MWTNFLLVRYQDTMKVVSDRFKDRPMSPQESVVYWTEYVIKHNGALHLRTVGADMPLYQYLLLDVISVTAVIIGVTVYIFLKIFRIICDFCSFGVKRFTSTTMHKKRI